MKRFIAAMLIAAFMVTLTGCSELSGVLGTTAPNGDSGENSVPVGAILPVFEDEEQGIKSTKIEFADFSLTIPEGYAYGKKEYTVDNMAGKTNTYNTYFVWMDAEDKEYVFDTDTDIMFYIYEGVDTDSPHPTLDKRTARAALRTVYANYFTNLVGLRNGLFEADTALNSTDEYWTLCFTGNSGVSISTTYGDTCYPNSYFGFFVMEAETDDSDRNFYGFVFSNDALGEIFKESEYNDLMKQIMEQFAITEFNGSLESRVDVTGGYTYEHLITDSMYTNNDGKILKRGIFYNTLMYYVVKAGRNTERTNVDGNGEKKNIYVVTERKPWEHKLVVHND